MSNGFGRKMVINTIGGFAKIWTSFLNSTTVHNPQTLLRLVESRPSSVPLLTVSNHMSTLDDPLLWGFKAFPTTNSDQARWVLAAQDICFTNFIYSSFFRLGKCIPITRGAGIYQPNINEALQQLSIGAWLHTFPEGKVCQEDGPIRRLKWGTASLIVRSPVTPIVLPIVHHGFHEVMPEKYMFGRRPLIPLWNKKISIIVGEPMEFDLPRMKQMAVASSQKFSLPSLGWPTTSDGLDEAAQRCLYSAISEEIRSTMESLRIFGRSQKV